MIVYKTSRKKQNILSHQRELKFRDALVIFPKKKGNIVFLTTYNNIYLKYEAVTIPLANGTYKVRVTTLDNLENESSYIEGTVAVSFFVLAPVDLEASVSNNDVTLEWAHSVNGAPDNYRIYGNGGSGEDIDRTTPIATIAGNLLTYTFTVVDGDWKFVVESIEAGQESVNLYAAYATVPVENQVPDSPGVSNESPYSVVGINLSNVSVGKVKISFLWLYGSSAASFRVYHDSGTGTIDYNTPAFTFTRQDSDTQEYTTTQLHSLDEDVTYKFVVRAVTSFGVEDKNTDSAEITIDGVAPDDPIDLSLSTAF